MAFNIRSVGGQSTINLMFGSDQNQSELLAQMIKVYRGSEVLNVSCVVVMSSSASTDISVFSSFFEILSMNSWVTSGLTLCCTLL